MFFFLRLVVVVDIELYFVVWGRAHGTDPSDESAEFYVEQTDIMQMERQLIDDVDYGIWN